MTSQPLLFDITASKHKGNEHSKAANLRVHPHKTTLRQRVLELAVSVGRTGITLKEAAGRLDRPLHSLSGRFSELVALGEIERTDETRDGCGVMVACRRGGQQ